MNDTALELQNLSKCQKVAEELNKKPLSRQANYMLVNAFQMMWKSGELFMNNQTIASILVSANAVEETRRLM